MKKAQPPAYYRAELEKAEAELAELDAVVRKRLKPLAGMTTTQIQTLETELKPTTDRIAALQSQIRRCRRELVA